jgi:hypothetical protein
VIVLSYQTTQFESFVFPFTEIHKTWGASRIAKVLISPIFFAELIFSFPYKAKINWSLFMPFATLAAGIVGSKQAGLLPWLPTITIHNLYPPWGKQNVSLNSCSQV